MYDLQIVRHMHIISCIVRYNKTIKLKKYATSNLKADEDLLGFYSIYNLTIIKNIICL